MTGRLRRRRLFQAQKSRKPRRCQARTVSGLTMTTAARHPFQSFDSQTHSIRSAAVSRSRWGRDRFITWSWCRNARISSCRAARWRSDAHRVESNKTMTGRIDPDATRGSRQGQSLQEEPNYWQAQPLPCPLSFFQSAWVPPRSDEVQPRCLSMAPGTRPKAFPFSSFHDNNPVCGAS